MEKIEDGHDQGFISAITLTEIISILGKANAQLAYELIAYLEKGNITILPIEKEIAKKAGDLKLRYSEVNLSTADRLIIATAILEEADTVVTTDTEWSKVNEINTTE